MKTCFKAMFRIAVLATSLIAAGCGTTSGLQGVDGKGAVVDLMPYSTLIIEDFTDEATANAKPEVRPLLKPKLDSAIKQFPDQIAAVVEAGGGFDEVKRSGTSGPGVLLLRGAITQYDEGSAALRLLVGFAAGNANFDANLYLVDGTSGEELGAWKIDKNSWALGGMVAATQTPESFMQEAAKKVGEELSVKRKAGSIAAPESVRR